MELAFVIYLIDNLCAMKGSFWGLGLFGLILVFTVFLGGLLVLMLMDTYGSEGREISLKIFKYWKKIMLCIFPILLIGSVLNIVIPAKDTAYKMLAAWGVQETVVAAQQSEYVQKMAGKSLQLLEKTIDKYLEEVENKPQEQKNTKQTKEKN